MNITTSSAAFVVISQGVTRISAEIAGLNTDGLDHDLRILAAPS